MLITYLGKSSLKQQDISLKDCVGNLVVKAPRNYDHIIMFLVGAILSAAAVLTLKSCVDDIHIQPVQAAADCGQCHNRYTSYFQRKGSPEPERMAYAVLKRGRNSNLLSAIAVAESSADPSIRKGGRNGKYSGAFQTDPAWGKIKTGKNLTADDVAHQALIAEFALTTHVAEEKDIIRGLNAYGGVRKSQRDKHKYAFNILRELQEVPK